MKHVIVVFLLAAAAFAQTPVVGDGGGGGGGSGTVQSNAANDVMCGQGGTTTGPCETGAFTYDGSTLQLSGTGSDSITLNDEDPSSISSPAANHFRLFFDETNSSKLSYKNSSGTVAEIGSEVTGTIYKEFISGGCQNSVAASAFNFGASGFPDAACVTGSNNVYAVLQFDAGTDEAVIDRFRLQGSVPTINLDIMWRAAAVAGDVVWGMQTACIADAETGDPAWNTAQTVTDTVKSTTLQWNDAALASITTLSCAADEMLVFRFFRDADNVADTMAGDAHLIDLRFELVY